MYISILANHNWMCVFRLFSVWPIGQNQPKHQILFHKNGSQQDLCIMTLANTKKKKKTSNLHNSCCTPYSSTPLRSWILYSCANFTFLFNSRPRLSQRNFDCFFQVSNRSDKTAISPLWLHDSFWRWSWNSRQIKFHRFSKIKVGRSHLLCREI